MADKNIHRIFCGGNHTWLLVDEFLPSRTKARAPSPLYEPPEKLVKEPRKKEAEKENQHSQADKARKQKALFRTQ
jgi:hypothetical protein